ncbi:MAG: hypothetical protein GY938_18995 [Ketobacter sp.]|nr:hypothetical protein [Ketobacter sp.]
MSNYVILNSDLENDNDVFLYDSPQAAIDVILEEYNHAENVFFVEDGGGEIIYLVYAGNAWVPVRVGRG